MRTVAVVGAGAAGLMAALFAARAGARVVLAESTRDGGRKILISGGGRCNVLPSEWCPERYVSDSSPQALRRMLGAWPLREQRAFFEGELEIALAQEEETGKLFPVSNRARDVRDRLVEAVQAAGGRIWFEAPVLDLVPPRPEVGEPWRVEFAGAPALEADAVVLATGGLSVPATGSDGRGLGIAQRLGHSLNPTYPALTPLTAKPTLHAHLAGVSLDVTLRAPGVRPRFLATGGFLFTHRGYSGPAVLDASHLAVRSALGEGVRQELTVQWSALDRAAWEERLTGGGRGRVGNAVERVLPARLAAQLLAEAEVDPDTQLSHLKREGRRTLLRLLTEYPLPWTGDEGYKKAEVTGGGIPLSEVATATLESRIRPGLHLCGEILDAFGPIGGHNFLWAWSTGRSAGLAAAGAQLREATAS